MMGRLLRAIHVSCTGEEIDMFAPKIRRVVCSEAARLQQVRGARTAKKKKKENMALQYR
jgi:hypothetical protein